MNFQLIDLPLKREVTAEPISSLSTLIEAYRICTAALEDIAEKVPATLEEADALDKKERALHDRRAELLGLVISKDPNSLEDVKALLSLWYLEKLEETVDGKMIPSDDLVCKVCDFLDIE